ncbi:acetyl-CoA carboxylase biotin carboxyl carrier protein [Actinomadura rupiterrae]|uniref:acetyl-CoA carboxylase biotin carboxyl carrier protein n=1 Tax=Actinomadura rupiterrae TaxID=559627 RepID=UPI0020A26EC6|nr:biotin/lipoyl-containing protein [Actinomadura rupiterrae]MCP2341075.1 acetyl-CoA carboxylase biotin carboxyl carrier protein [Actinomadura rupiterrae]
MTDPATDPAGAPATGPAADPAGGPATGPEPLLDAVVRRAAQLQAAASAPVKRVRVQADDMTVEIEWAVPEAAPAAPAPVQAHPSAHLVAFPHVNGHAAGHAPGTAVANGGASGTAGVAVADPPEAAEDEGTVLVTAPAVGVFYRAPEPGAAPFVAVGDDVEPGQQVGILEAMKLMNPIEAEQAGRVVAVLVEDQAAVEYGQPLIRLAPAGGAAPGGA